jgi:ATPases with chaperone activity, ATP-binding subunit
MENGNALSALIKGIFSFLSINIIADFFIFSTDHSQDLSLYTLFFVFVLSPPGILYLWTHLDLNQKTMSYSQDEQNNITSIFSKFTSGKTISISNLRQTLDQHVIGQNYAKEEIAKQLVTQVKKAQAAGRNVRVLGTFFFVGPTGVGKTETAKAISLYFKRSGYQFLRFDMGNFANPHDAATLTGSPRGYIGSDEGGALTRPLMRNPKAVILFDEMEKADPTLFRTFMTLIDEGEIQETSTGKRVTLNNAIIIFTSNLYQGSIKEIITKEKDPIAAELAIRNLLTGNYHDALKYVSWEQIQMERPPDRHTSHGMTSKFPPEFIGRIDKVVPFTSLSEEDYKVIVKKLAAKYKKNVDVDAITKKNLPIAEKYGVRQFIKKVEEDILA